MALPPEESQGVTSAGKKLKNCKITAHCLFLPFHMLIPRAQDFGQKSMNPFPWGQGEQAVQSKSQQVNVKSEIQPLSRHSFSKGCGAPPAWLEVDEYPSYEAKAVKFL